MSDIPGFITRKLVIKESLKQSADGFSLDLLNTFAPATFLGIKVEADGKVILVDNITITPHGGENRKVSEITPDHPFSFSVGERYTLAVKNVNLTEGSLLNRSPGSRIRAEIGLHGFECLQKPSADGTVSAGCKHLQPAR